MASYRRVIWLLLALTCSQWPQSIAAEPTPSKPTPPDEQSTEGVPFEAGLMFHGPPSTWRTQTSGGVQLWADELCFHDWRIQRNVLLGHYRLLDGGNHRYARGSFEHCQQKLNEIKRERNLPPMKGRAVVMLHGLGSWRNKMTPLADYLKENGNYAVFNLAYPSTRGEIAEHSRCLAKVMEHLDGIDEINFVAHSMGNLVVRHYLADVTDEAIGRKPDPRIKRFVMLAPPNHGASAALMLKDHELLSLLMGSSASELGIGWAEVEKHLAIPNCEFGIIAGGRGRERGYNPLMEGDNDDLLPVTTTRLVGARDFVLVPIIHQFEMFDADVQRYTLSFLKHGYFISADKRQPVEK
ncbi:MAG TPA: alpha/beta fold hydrolase [Pirellulales bacterium]|nr:alpha/beta fold hydrolase [Pirellulales bacterium]